MAASYRNNTTKARLPIKRAPTLLLLLLTLTACICQHPASGQGAKERQEPSLQRESEKPPVAGGFTDIALDEPMVLEAHAFLREELKNIRPDILLGAVKQAARQIVAGTNIRLVCSYRIPPSRRGQELVATIYFDLKGNSTLRSIDFP